MDERTRIGENEVLFKSEVEKFEQSRVWRVIVSMLANRLVTHQETLQAMLPSRDGVTKKEEDDFTRGCIDENKLIITLPMLLKQEAQCAANTTYKGDE